MRVITVGTSGICRDTIKGFKRSGNIVHACVSRSIERARDFASKNGVKFYSSDYEKSLMSNNFDTVYIATPNALHFEYAKKALLASKNVILEKPFCRTLEEAKELFEIANSKRVYIFENMTTVHNPLMDTIEKEIKDIGPIRNVEASFYKLSAKYDEFLKGKKPPVFDPDMNGGALMDLNVYNIAFMLKLFGMPNTLSYHPHIEKDIDVSGTVMFHYDDLNATLIAGKNAHCKPHIMVGGEKGYIYVDGISSRFNSYVISHNGQTVSNRKINIDDFLAMCVGDIAKIIESNDKEKYKEYMKLTLLETNVLELLRKSGGLSF